MARVATQCDQCGQTDDHPKVHIGEVTKHHDCLSFLEREMVIGANQATDGAAEKIIVACEKGKRGDDLLAFIEKTHGGK
jgi:hypothetical protein